VAPWLILHGPLGCHSLQFEKQWVDHTRNIIIMQAFFFCTETNKNFHQEFSWTKLFACIISDLTEKDLLIEIRASDDSYSSPEEFCKKTAE
jgi:hypothetical protein